MRHRLLLADPRQVCPEALGGRETGGTRVTKREEVSARGAHGSTTGELTTDRWSAFQGQGGGSWKMMSPTNRKRISTECE